MMLIRDEGDDDGMMNEHDHDVSKSKQEAQEQQQEEQEQLQGGARTTAGGARGGGYLNPLTLCL